MKIINTKKISQKLEVSINDISSSKISSNSYIITKKKIKSSAINTNEKFEIVFNNDNSLISPKIIVK